MEKQFPEAVPEIPVSDINRAVAYYKNQLGFSIDWGGEEGGIAGISRGLQNVPYQSSISTRVRQRLPDAALAQSQ
ncbi:hypothetical protein GCM10011487_69370 [Steroidobacter agaridevorans]|uniref:Glyoxalase n=1 Tax=Steroidobacter agaridevorans TaxID=2695856 RepID=A0A829YNL7_9GAMM|nr:hypothetical protein [Steroidobacter agaridevorans]GFE84937.1 hypothetical protein GCM10011487_69370 [Steroidobacter agaridevorans]